VYLNPKMTHKISLLSICFILFSASTHARTWTNAEGRSIEAEFIELNGSEVAIKMNGERYEIPLESLSEQDQAYVKSESQRRIEAAAAEARQFMGQTLINGKVMVFKHRLSEENQQIAAKGGSGWDDSFASGYSGDWIKDISKYHELDEITVALGMPDDFDPVAGAPIFVQWATSDRKSHVRGARAYWEDCRDKGWILVSLEGSPDAAKTWSNSVFYAGIKEFFEQLHAKYPGSEAWPVATGGFSGGSKICQWMGGLMSELDGVNFKGFWIGGCNEALFDFALEDMSVSKSAYRGKKAFISSGSSDRLVTDQYRENVEAGAKDVRLEVRSEIYEGGHRINSAHFRSALDWFLN